MLHRESVLGHDHRARGGGAELPDGDHGPVRSHVSLPSERGGGFHAHPRRHRGGQHRFPVCGGLRLEKLPRRHRDHAAAHPLGRQLPVRLQRERHLGPCRDEDELQDRGRAPTRRAHRRRAPRPAGARAAVCASTGKFLPRQDEADRSSPGAAPPAARPRRSRWRRPAETEAGSASHAGWRSVPPAGESARPRQARYCRGSRRR